MNYRSTETNDHPPSMTKIKQNARMRQTKHPTSTRQTTGRSFEFHYVFSLCIHPILTVRDNPASHLVSHPVSQSVTCTATGSILGALGRAVSPHSPPQTRPRYSPGTP